jgi:Cys-tRNA synthase (O-phospho-L-seryl-tRNA:Cys-tRNA synthase)
MQDKNHMIISIDAEKHWNSSAFLMISTLIKLSIENINLILIIFEKPMTNIISNGKKNIRYFLLNPLKGKGTHSFHLYSINTDACKNNQRRKGHNRYPNHKRI